MSALPATCHCAVHGGDAASVERRAALAHALRLEYLTVGWNLIEGLIAVGAAVGAGSVALLGFGIDSFVETSSGLVLLWRLRVELHHRAPVDLRSLDRRAHRLVALSLLLLAAYVAVDSVRTLIERRLPQPTSVGLALTAISLPVMLWLGRAKRRVARRIDSHAMESDAFQTTACMWLSFTALVGVGLNAAFGWAWADPLSALVMAYFLAREARSAWRGEACCTG